MSKAHRIEVIYVGRVQGVGFRFTVLNMAQRLRRSGFVENLPDGTVRMVAEGNREQLGDLLAEIRASAIGRHITGEEVHWSDAQGRYDAFEVRY